MRCVQRLWAVALVVFLGITAILPVKADEERVQTCKEELLGYYSTHQEDAAQEIEACLRTLEAEDPVQGRLWRRIMADWSVINQAGYDTRRALHDGLPQDDSLCIVVFGYALNADGSMKPELENRLRTALNAARQYPNAFVMVTGGGTSDVEGVTEAGVMASWLRKNGISPKRIILETKAMSTTQNALKVYRILAQNYPQVQQLAAVTSDYHIAFAATLLQTVSTYQSATQGTRAIPVAAGISCATDTTDKSMLSSQAWGIANVTGVNWVAGTPNAKDAVVVPPKPVAVPERVPEWDQLGTDDWPNEVRVPSTWELGD